MTLLLIFYLLVYLQETLKSLGKTVLRFRVRVLLFKEGLASFSSSTCDDCVFKQLMS